MISSQPLNTQINIDNTNFAKQLPHILERVRSCDFIAFDGEFSGLQTRPEHKQNEYQSEEEFYQRIKQTCVNYSLIQFGICCYTFQEQQRVYVPAAYNFYLKEGSHSNRKITTMMGQIDCLDFLAKNSMDFTRVFSKGIMSRPLAEKSKVIDDIKNCTLSYKNRPKEMEEWTVLSAKDQKVYEEVMAKIDALKETKKKQGIIDFQSRIVFEQVKLSGKVNLEKDRKFELKEYEFIVKLAREKKGESSEVKEKTKDFDTKYIQEMGVSIVVEEILKNKKPLVGHFIGLDLGFLYQVFIEDLPETLEEFSIKIKSLLPHVYDTKCLSKYIQKTLKGIRVDLTSLFQACYDQKLLQPYCNVKISDFQSDGCHHEAGYDAFITGCAFVGISNYIIKNKQDQLAERLRIHDIPSNHVIYSKCSGEVELGVPASQKYHKKVLVTKGRDVEEYKKQLADFGSYKVTVRDKVYIVYEEQQDLQAIVKCLSEKGLNGLCKYTDRLQFRAIKYL